MSTEHHDQLDCLADVFAKAIVYIFVPLAGLTLSIIGVAYLMAVIW